MILLPVAIPPPFPFMTLPAKSPEAISMYLCTFSAHYNQTAVTIEIKSMVIIIISAAATPVVIAIVTPMQTLLIHKKNKYVLEFN